MIPRLSSEPAASSIYQDFCAELQARGFSGELTLGDADRTVLATDNSIYQLIPQAIAFPRGTDDLVRIARMLGEERFRAIKVAPRGGGTGTNGQSLTDGLVVDLSRYMNRILEIDPERRTARVEAAKAAVTSALTRETSKMFALLNEPVVWFVAPLATQRTSPFSTIVALRWL